VRTQQIEIDKKY